MSNHDQLCPTKETLVAYAYGECDLTERKQVDTHLESCASCTDELQSFGALRGALGEWTVPDTSLGFRVVADASTSPAPLLPVASLVDDASGSWWKKRLAPVWNVALVSTLVLVVAAAVASVEFRYDESGFVFRMGWAQEVAVDQVVFESERTEIADVAREGTPWRADLSALEQLLRAELVSSSSSASGPPDIGNPDALHQEMLALIQESERRQQQEFASGLITLAQEFDLQRREDQLRVREDVDSLTDYVVRLVGR